jgi:hypothetical protein
MDFQRGVEGMELKRKRKNKVVDNSGRKKFF